MDNDPKGFFMALLDFSFSEFITTKLIKILYAILLIIIAVGFLGGMFTALVRIFRGPFWAGLGLLCITPIVTLLYVILARAWTELIIVLFRIAENTTELVQQGRQKAKSE